jgi:predicted GIY-YIG superfamily endonuclease
MTSRTVSLPIRVQTGLFGERETTEETAVYRIFSADDTLLYVGMSVSPETRFADHRTCKRWMREDAHHYRIAWYGTRAEADAEEKRAIRQERPLHNSMHRVRPQRQAGIPQGKRADLDTPDGE